MVSLEEKINTFQLREYYFSKVIENGGSDPFKSYFSFFLGIKITKLSFDFDSLPLYQKCAIAGLEVIEKDIADHELLRLLGQAPKIDSTPRPWVTDIFGVMSVKWLAERQQDSEVDQKLKTWLEGFLRQKVYTDRFNVYEKDLVNYILNEEGEAFSSACIPLFLHYKGILPLSEHKDRKVLLGKFLNEFASQFKNIESITLLSLMVFVFDKINEEIAVIPPNGWGLDDLVTFLKHIPIGLKRWTWENKGRTKNAEPVTWLIENEYHVQNLLYVLLGPIFNDISDELYLQPLGQKTPRIDLYIPSMHTIIEVKYRKNTNKSFQSFIGEIGEDNSLYRADPTYKDARIVCFLWDHTRASQEHAKFIEGVMKIRGMDECVVISSPSMIN